MTAEDMIRALAATMREKESDELGGLLLEHASDEMLAQLAVAALVERKEEQAPPKPRAKRKPRRPRETLTGAQSTLVSRPASRPRETEDTAPASALEEKIYKVIVGADEPLRFSEIVEAAGRDQSTVNTALKKLLDGERIFRAGTHKRTRYAVTQEAANEAALS